MSRQEASKAAGGTLHSKEVDAAPSQPGAGLCGDSTGRLGGQSQETGLSVVVMARTLNSVDFSLEQQGSWPPAGNSP